MYPNSSEIDYEARILSLVTVYVSVALMGVAIDRCNPSMKIRGSRPIHREIRDHITRRHD
jgi:hypothetical protein